jgi:hypothetical protein
MDAPDTPIASFDKLKLKLNLSNWQEKQEKIRQKNFPVYNKYSLYILGKGGNNDNARKN